MFPGIGYAGFVDTLHDIQDRNDAHRSAEVSKVTVRCVNDCSVFLKHFVSLISSCVNSLNVLFL